VCIIEGGRRVLVVLLFLICDFSHYDKVLLKV
jgi:hypothetical protein